jgi:hypothetical protein
MTTNAQFDVGSTPQLPQRPPRRHRVRKALMIGVPAVAGLLIGMAVGHPVTQVKTVSHPIPGPTVTETVQTQAAPQPTVTVTKTVTNTVTHHAASETGGGRSGGGGTQVVTRFNGTGTQNTGTFTVPDSWHLSWSYWGCPAPPANFQVSEYNSDGSIDFNGVTVNELGSGRGPVATYAYGDGGTHYFSVNTEGCSWSLAVVTGG